MNIRALQHTTRRRVHGDGGAVMVEAAFMLPIFFLFIFAIIEFGFFFRDRMSVGNAANDGARQAASSGTDAFADYNMLQTMAPALNALDAGQLNYVVIYKAANRTTSVPA